MLDAILTVATGGISGFASSIVGKLFSFADGWMEEKRAVTEHQRTMEMHRLQAELHAGEQENELAIAEAQAAAEIRRAAYEHDRSAGRPSKWCTNVLRLVRPFLSMSLIGLTAAIYFSARHGSTGQIEIEAGVIWMTSAAVMFWFGDRSMQPKRK
jgi:hypothetical protein